MSSQMIGSDLSLEAFNNIIDRLVAHCTSNPGTCGSKGIKEMKRGCLSYFEIATCDAMVEGVFEKLCASRPVDKKDAAYCKKLFPDSTTTAPTISTTPPSSTVSNLTPATATFPESSNNLGVLIGCLVGAVFLVIIVVLICWWRRRKSMDKELSSIGGKSESKSKKPVIAEKKRKSIWIVVDDGNEEKK